MHMESELVRTEIQGHISIISLHRQDKRNAFDIALTNALNEALDTFEDEPQQWVAVLTGGTDMFSAGSDLKEGSGKTHRGGEYGIIRRGRLKPVIAAAEGLALGGGMEILLLRFDRSFDKPSAGVARSKTRGAPHKRRFI